MISLSFLGDLNHKMLGMTMQLTADFRLMRYSL